MGAYTWTYIRVDKLTKEQTVRCVKKAKDLVERSTFGRYLKLDFDEALKNWLKLNQKNREFLIKECGVSPEDLKKDPLTKKLERKLKICKEKLDLYDKCLNGELTLEDLLKKTNQLKEDLPSDFNIIERARFYYVHTDYEIFRNYESDNDNEYFTVHDLIEHLKKPGVDSICDFEDGLVKSVQPEYGPLSEALEEKIKKYYTEIGDYNFCVHFG